jgi:tRNA-2-methylthio-N6-dimethylallyladenosine synthase
LQHTGESGAKSFRQAGETGKTVANGKIIGVLGCVAQQEGEEIFERAPVGQSGLRVGELSKTSQNFWRSLKRAGRRVTGLDLDTDETFENGNHAAG